MTQRRSSGQEPQPGVRRRRFAGPSRRQTGQPGRGVHVRECRPGGGAHTDCGIDRLRRRRQRSARIVGRDRWGQIVAGAPTDDGGGRGSAYTFSRNGATARTETAKLTPSDSQVLRLGSSVAIDATTIVAGGALGAASATAPAGAVYTFARTGAIARTETAKLSDPSGAPGDTLGLSIAIDSGVIVAGAPFDDVGTNPDQGSASVFFSPLASPPPPPPPPPPPTAASSATREPGSLRAHGQPGQIPDGGTAEEEIPAARGAPRSASRSPAERRSSSASRELRRAAPSRRACQPTRRANRAKPRCTRYITIGSIQRPGPRRRELDPLQRRSRRQAPGARPLQAHRDSH